MTSSELITEIEEGAVRADLAVASTTYALLQRMEESAVLNEARRLLGVSPEESVVFLKRASTLFDSPAPDGYAHPADLSLSAYVFLLAHVPQQPAQEFVERVACSSRADSFAACGVARYFSAHVPAGAVPKVANRL